MNAKHLKPQQVLFEVSIKSLTLYFISRTPMYFFSLFAFSK